MRRNLQRFLQIETQIKKVFLDEKIPFELTDHDKIVAKNLIHVLEPVEKAVKELSKKEINIVHADIILSDLTNSLKKSNNEFSEMLVENLMTRITSRRSKYSDIAFFLARNVNKEKNIFYVEPTKYEVIELLHDFESDHIIQTDNRDDDFFTVSQTNNVEIQLQLFLETGIQQKTIKSLITSLTSIAPTSTECERVFSTSGRLLVPFRQSLKDDIINDIILINKFYNL